MRTSSLRLDYGDWHAVTNQDDEVCATIHSLPLASGGEIRFYILCRPAARSKATGFSAGYPAQ